MADRALVLFDDRTARDWEPFTLTRPVGELRFGALTLRERAERVFDAPCLGHLTHGALRPLDEPTAAPVLAAAQLPRERDLLVLSARAVPDWQAPPVWSDRAELIVLGDQVCGWYAPAGAELPPDDFFLEPARHAPDGLRSRAIGGRVLERVWQLVALGAEQLAGDVAALFPDAPRPDLPSGVHTLGAAPLVLGEDVAIEPGVVFDLSEGPVWLDHGARVRAFNRIAGPTYIGRGSTLLGGPFSAVSIGPFCKVHGEMEEAVVLGYSNKAHDGFLGHAYVGCWVNLGALTTNSDLKNNYGSVRIWTPSGVADTGEMKLGCLIGDHVKTAIGTLLATGTVVGAGSNLFGDATPSRYVPPFTWGNGDSATAYDLEKFLATAETAMGRRDVRLSPAQRALLSAAWRRGRSEPDA